MDSQVSKHNAFFEDADLTGLKKDDLIEWKATVNEERKPSFLYIRTHVGGNVYSLMKLQIRGAFNRVSGSKYKSLFVSIS